ncbi:hypothetical protein B0H19DRAFT_1062448 [Mycena capillaripes]|nr:hypothetical protein B0H19DRAFT_1062448 [Mycena capillaripes]
MLVKTGGATFRRSFKTSHTELVFVLFEGDCDFWVVGRNSSVMDVLSAGTRAPVPPIGGSSPGARLEPDHSILRVSRFGMECVQAGLGRGKYGEEESERERSEAFIRRVSSNYDEMRRHYTIVAANHPPLLSTVRLAIRHIASKYSSVLGTPSLPAKNLGLCATATIAKILDPKTMPKLPSHIFHIPHNPSFPLSLFGSRSYMSRRTSRGRALSGKAPAGRWISNVEGSLLHSYWISRPRRRVLIGEFQYRSQTQAFHAIKRFLIAPSFLLLSLGLHGSPRRALGVMDVGAKAVSRELVLEDSPTEENVLLRMSYACIMACKIVSLGLSIVDLIPLFSNGGRRSGQVVELMPALHSLWDSPGVPVPTYLRGKAAWPQVLDIR